MEIAGLGTGVVSLAFDVFDNTIRLFKFITALVDMPKDCEKYRLQLIMEYNRVLAWGKAAGLVDVPEGKSLASTLGTNPTELISIVARIQWLLAEFRDLNCRYGNELRSDEKDHGVQEEQSHATDAHVLRQISNLAISYEAKTKERGHRHGLKYILAFVDKVGRTTKEIATHPSRVRWIMIDREAFEALLEDLHILTERLHELMRDYRESRIDDITAKTYREMIITRNGVQDLRDMLDAATGLVAMSSTVMTDSVGSTNNKVLQDLVRLKKISRTSEMILSQLAVANNPSKFDLQKVMSDLDITVQRYTQDLWNDRFWLNEEDNDNAEQLCQRPRGVLTTPDGDIPVWIEYKTLGRFAPGSLKDNESALRTVALAEMLHIPKPASLHVPECVGYFDDREIGKAERYGWIFKMPEGSDYDTRVRSLYEILGDPDFKPTLSQRLQMAYKLCSTVLNLHAAQWVHKGIFSDNVIFHFNDAGYPHYDPTSPYLSGFEFSRPEGTDTTSRETDLAWDLYRWPGIQRQPPLERNSRKTYDLYSLGLVLLEIAHWEPLWKILGLSPNTTRSGYGYGSGGSGGGGEHVEQRVGGGGGGVLSTVGTMISMMSVEHSDDDDNDKTGSDKSKPEGAGISRRTTAATIGTGPTSRTTTQPVIVPYVPLSDSKQVRSWLLGIRHHHPRPGGNVDANLGTTSTSTSTSSTLPRSSMDAAIDTSTTQAPFEKQSKPNPVTELRNIMGDRYYQAVTRCLWAHAERGFGVCEDGEDEGNHHYDACETEATSAQDRNGRLVEEGIKLQDAFTRFVVEELERIVV